MASSIDPPTPRQLIGSFALFALMGILISNYGASLPGFSTHFQLAGGQAATIFSAHNAGALAVTLLLLLAGPRGTHWRMALSAAAMGLGAAALHFAPSWSACLLAAGLLGAGWGGLLGGVNGIFATRFGPRSGWMITLLNAVFGLGAITGPFLAASALTLPITGAACVLLSPLLLGLSDHTPSQVAPGSATRGLNAALPGALVFGLMVMAAVAMETASGGWTATQALSVGKSAAQAAQYTSLFFLSLTLGRFVVLALAARLSAQTLVIGGFTLNAGLYFLNHQSGNPLFLALTGLGVAPLFGLIMVWANTRIRNLPGLSSIVIGTSIAGNIVMPLVLAAAVQRGGMNALSAALLLVALVGLLLSGAVMLGNKRATLPGTVIKKKKGSSPSQAAAGSNESGFGARGTQLLDALSARPNVQRTVAALLGDPEYQALMALDQAGALLIERARDITAHSDAQAAAVYSLPLLNIFLRGGVLPELLKSGYGSADLVYLNVVLGSLLRRLGTVQRQHDVENLTVPILRRVLEHSGLNTYGQTVLREVTLNAASAQASTPNLSLEAQVVILAEQLSRPELQHAHISIRPFSAGASGVTPRSILKITLGFPGQAPSIDHLQATLHTLSCGELIRVYLAPYQQRPQTAEQPEIVLTELASD